MQRVGSGIAGMDQLAPKKVYESCPVLTPHELLNMWDPLVALVEILSYCADGYRLDSCRKNRQILQLYGHPGHDDYENVLLVLKQLTCRQDACVLVGSFLLQFLGLICAPNECFQRGRRHKGVSTIPHQVSEPVTAQELTSMLLQVSRKDQGFCQHLHFLLRSFISTLETPRPKDDGSRNLVALLNCLELLRFAEKELAGRPQSPGNNGIAPTISDFERLQEVQSTTGSISDSDTRENQTTAKLSTAHEPKSLDASPRQQNHAASISPNEEPLRAFQKQDKKLGFFGRFRKKKVSKVGGASYTMMPTPTSQVATPSPVHSIRSIGTMSSDGFAQFDSSNQNGTPIQFCASDLQSGHDTRPREPESLLRQKAVGAAADFATSLIESPSIMYDNMSNS